MEIWVLQATLGLFVLYATWAPKFKSSNPGPLKFFGCGVFGGFATMFVGGTGPLVAPVVNAACKERQEVVSTHAVLMTFQHFFKVILFGVLGFAFGPYIPLLLGLIIFGVCGTIVGKKVLDKLHGTQNRTANFKTVIALIIDGVENLFQGECKGDITNIRCGAEGFGYDPIFIPHTFDKTFAEMTKQEKGLISHRGKAVKKLLGFLSTD
ncbi:MAG: hypothetical protein CMD19_00100 [Flavobacteriales bacterium]|nr:hypothetical protein [Flavobacteriales bacterium]